MWSPPNTEDVLTYRERIRLIEEQEWLHQQRMWAVGFRRSERQRQWLHRATWRTIWVVWAANVVVCSGLLLSSGWTGVRDYACVMLVVAAYWVHDTKRKRTS